MAKNRKWTLLTSCIIVLLIGIALSTSFIFRPSKQGLNPSGTKPAVFFAPHPDDETLNMGVTIAEYVKSGRPVYIVLLTHGRESGALLTINKSLQAQRKYDLFGPITRDQLEVARIKEFYNASRALGVPDDHLFVEYLDKGKMAITYPQTKEVTKKYIQKFPDADFFALSWMDIHYDHRVSGRALRDLYVDGTLDPNRNRVYFFISMATKMYMKARKITPPGIKDSANSYAVQAMVRNAMKAYNDWDPKRGSFAIGYNSVNRQFKKLNHEMYHYVHGVDAKEVPGVKYKE